jgi:hypothetical protein
MTPRKAAVLLLVLFLGTCNQAIMTAPPGSTFATGTLVANPGFIASHGDVSVISGLLVKATGDPVADGTVVQFFTDLGKIDEQGKTNDGVVRVNLVSDSRSGTATIQAFSGGTAVGPSFVDGPVVGFSTGSITGGSAVSAETATATATVIIGSARPSQIVVSADPPHITTGRSTTILAQVFDKDGNPVANAPVIFTLDCGLPGCSSERLASGGQAVFTDNNGRATDTLHTNSVVLNRTVTVKATVPGAAGTTPGTTTVTIN